MSSSCFHVCFLFLSVCPFCFLFSCMLFRLCILPLHFFGLLFRPSAYLNSKFVCFSSRLVCFQFFLMFSAFDCLFHFWGCSLFFRPRARFLTYLKNLKKALVHQSGFFRPDPSRWQGPSQTLKWSSCRLELRPITCDIMWWWYDWYVSWYVTS